MKKNPKSLSLSLVAFIMIFLSSCNLTPSINEIPRNPCEECVTPTSPNNPPFVPPTIPTRSPRNQLGYNTGIQDAKNLFNGTYIEVPCDIGSDLPTKGFTSPTIVNGISKCFMTTLANLSGFNSFIIGYRENLTQKINQGIDVEFNSGLLEGFNYQLMVFRLNYGISII